MYVVLYYLMLSHYGPMRRLKPVNTGSQKHVTEMLKNAEKHPRPSGHLIPHNITTRYSA